MNTKEIKINRSIEKFDFEALSHIAIIAVLLAISISCGMKTMPERTVLMERKETVHKVNEVVLHSNNELFSSIDFPLESIENELKPEMLKPTVETVIDPEAVKLPESVLKPEEIVQSEQIVQPEVIINPEEIVKPEETVIPEEIIPDSSETVTSILSYTGNLRTDYCVGSYVGLDELEIILDNEIIPLEDCVVQEIDTTSPGENIVTIAYKEYLLEIPYTVVDYKVILHGADEEIVSSLFNYELDTNVIGIPAKLGKEFTGWYRDEACTVPFVSALPGETQLDLYAGWKEFDKFACDEAGYITEYTGMYGSITDGLLNLTAHPSCVGVRADAFVNLEEFVTDIYIPANITNIEKGAFDCLPYVFYIYVHPDNPVYSSDAGILYTKDMSTVVAYPSCR